MRVAVLACVLVGLIPRQAVESPPSTLDPFCFRPLEEFCARKECVTYAAQVKTMRAGGNCSASSFGQCGTLRITYTSNGLHSETRYFDKAGKLIAVRTGTDVYLIPACPDWTHYGAEIKCRVTNVRLCNPLTRAK
jgi:hypothetical protein